jgi:hypothetical protein
MLPVYVHFIFHCEKVGSDVEGNIKIDFQNYDGWGGGVEWIDLTQPGDK